MGPRAAPADLREGPARLRSIRRRRLSLDPTILARFPTGYRHLAYLQTLIGYDVKRDMPGLEGPEVEALYRDGANWLAGRAIDHRLRVEPALG